MTFPNLEQLPFLSALPFPPIVVVVAGAVLIVLLVAMLWAFASGRGRRTKAKALASRTPAQVLDARLLATPQTSPDSLQGGLKHMPLPDLLQFLAQGRRTGTLEISSGRRGGLIRLVQGMVVHAEYRRTEDLDALFGLLTMETGDFVFTPTTPPDYQVSGREVVDILMLWLSRKDGLA